MKLKEVYSYCFLKNRNGSLILTEHHMGDFKSIIRKFTICTHPGRSDSCPGE